MVLGSEARHAIAIAKFIHWKKGGGTDSYVDMVLIFSEHETRSICTNIMTSQFCSFQEARQDVLTKMASYNARILFIAKLSSPVYGELTSPNSAPKFMSEARLE